MSFNKYLAEKGGKAYCYGIWGLVLTLALVLILGNTLGTAFFNYQIEVPLYMREEMFQSRDDAIVETRLKASSKGGVATHQLERMSSQNAQGVFLTLDLVYIGNNHIYDSAIVKAISELEESVLDSEAYLSMCALEWSGAEKAAVQSEDWSKVKELNAAATKPKCMRPRSILSYPMGVLGCATNTSSCESKDLVFTQDVIDAKISQMWSQDPFTSPAAYQFYLSTSNTFGKNGTQQGERAIRSTFYFGMPLKGFDNLEDRPDEQQALLDEFLVTDFLEFLLDKHTALDKSIGVKLWFNGPGLMMGYTQRRIPQDVSKALGSFCFVFFFLAYMKKSFWYASQGMAMIFLAFPPAYILYWGILRQDYFGIFNLLSIFIVLGIGADDIFVLLDCWSASGREDPEISSSLVRRFTWTRKTAGGAMGLTSVTTIVSFLATARSTFPGISTFGFFAACLVFVNFCLVIMFYPTVISVKETVLKAGTYCCCAFRGEEVAIAAAEGHDKEGTISTTEPDIGVLNRYFRDKHGPFCYKFRYLVVLLFAGIIAVFVVFAIQIEVDPDPPVFYGDGNNFAEYMPALSANFGGVGNNMFNMKIEAVLGIDSTSPIDREGTNPAIITERGKVNYTSEEFSFHRVAPCALAICKQFRVKNETLSLEGANKSPITCWVEDFYNTQFAPQANATAAWAKALSPSGKTLWDAKFDAFAKSQVFLKHKKHLVYGKDGSGATVPRMSIVEVETSEPFDLKLGQDFAEMWDKTFKRWYTESVENGGLPECVAISSTTGGFVTSFQKAARTYVAKQLMVEAFSGIFMSICLGFVILTLFSGNFIVAGLAMFTISCVVMGVVAYIVVVGRKIGMIESMCLVFSPGLAIDSTCHLAESYLHDDGHEGTSHKRKPRMDRALSHIGVSIVSGSLTTTGACVFLFFCEIVFFQSFGSFIFIVITLSFIFALGFFPALMYIIGPQDNTGNLVYYFKKLRGQA